MSSDAVLIRTYKEKVMKKTLYDTGDDAIKDEKTFNVPREDKQSVLDLLAVGQ